MDAQKQRRLMMNRAPTDFDEDRDPEGDFKPLDAQAARQLTATLPRLVPWKLLVWQLVGALVLALLAWLWSGRAAVVLSVAYGALAVMLPAVLLVQGMVGLQRAQGKDAAMALIVFMACEFGKIVLTVVLLLVAPRILGGQLNWLGLLISVIVTLKMYWIALVVQFRSRNRNIVEKS